MLILEQKKIIKEIKNSLTDDLRKESWRGNKNKLAGHCYVASEAAFHLSVLAQEDPPL